jgi:hypothetical protein
MGKPDADNGTDWRRDWDPMVAAVGRDFSDGAVVYGADPVAPADIRRFLEPLEFDCRLHYDRAAAIAAGFSDLILPYTAVLSWSIRGAFMTWESELVTSEGEVIARMRTGNFAYVPRPAGGWHGETGNTA